MGALRISLLALLLAAPLGAVSQAQAPPPPSTVGDVVNEGQDTVYPEAENQSGQELTSEDINLDVLVDIREAEFDMVGVMLGGGSAKTSIAIEAQLAVRAVNASRVEQALDMQYEEANASAYERLGVDTSRTVFTADELRGAGAGIVLEAFQAYQERLTRNYLAETLPQVTILTTRFDWENTRPAQEGTNETDPDPREPPLILEVDAQMQFLDRYSLADLLRDDGNSSDAETPRERLQERLLENETVPVRQQSAFQVMAIGQLVALELPPGWRLNLTVELPKGYTISSATDALVVDEDRESASYYVDGTGQESIRTTSGVVKLSDRSLVTMTLVVLSLAVGFLLRLPTEFAGHRWLGPED